MFPNNRLSFSFTGRCNCVMSYLVFDMTCSNQLIVSPQFRGSSPYPCSSLTYRVAALFICAISLYTSFLICQPHFGFQKMCMSHFGFQKMYFRFSDNVLHLHLHNSTDLSELLHYSVISRTSSTGIPQIPAISSALLPSWA